MLPRLCRIVPILAALVTAIPAQQTIQASVGYALPNTNSVAPGHVTTLFVQQLLVPDTQATQYPLPTSLSGVSVGVQAEGQDTTGYPSLLPILRIQSYPGITGITVEIPTEGICAVPPQGGTCADVTRNQVPPSLTFTVQSNGVYLQPMNGYRPHFCWLYIEFVRHRPRFRPKLSPLL